jgi:dihydroorotate dehydrogenase electron transfer subunit
MESSPAVGTKGRYLARVAACTTVAEGHFVLRLECPGAAAAAVPGQFVQVGVSDIGVDPLLRRPICVSASDGRCIELVIRATGRGTEVLAQRRLGSRVDLLGPLGHGFTPPLPQHEVALVGGGVGIAPLQYLHSSMGRPSRAHVFMGAQTAELMPRLPRILAADDLHIATDDGSEGFRGTTVELLASWLDGHSVDRVYACGPRAMLRALAALTRERGLWCEVSLEERMACGFGVCMGCSVPMVAGGYKRACREGPVFDAAEVKWS